MTIRNSVSKINLTFNPHSASRLMHDSLRANVKTSRNTKLISLYGNSIPMNDRTKALMPSNEMKEREKRELELLNCKFASYIERVRFLEAKNHKLHLDIEAFRQFNERNAQKISEFYKSEIKDLEQAASEISTTLSKTDDKVKKAQSDRDNIKTDLEEAEKMHNELKTKNVELEEKMISMNGSIDLHNAHVRNLKEELNVLKMRIQLKSLEINNTKNDLQNEILLKKSIDTEKTIISEEINYLKQTHACEVEELLNKIGSDFGIDPSSYFRNDLSNAIIEIRKEYDDIVERTRNALSSQFMNLLNENVRHDVVGAPNEQLKQLIDKILISKQNIDNEIMVLKNTIADLKAKKEMISKLIEDEIRKADELLKKKDEEIAQLTNKIKQVNDDYLNVSKMEVNLNAEINKYRSLLEGESPGDGLRGIVNNIEEEMRIIQGERFSKVTYNNQPTSKTSYYISRHAASNFSDDSYEIIKYPTALSSNLIIQNQNLTAYKDDHTDDYTNYKDDDDYAYYNTIENSIL